ncbi:unnamed protein product [Amoebophrya sp. A25]|nr:unnamed protein product [Amoebophrya sp. A25]|eukprot:GSA25T00010118001.1
MSSSHHDASGARGSELDEAEAGICSFAVWARPRGLGGQIKVEMEDFEVIEQENPRIRRKMEEFPDHRDEDAILATPSTSPGASSSSSSSSEEDEDGGEKRELPSRKRQRLSPSKGSDDTTALLENFQVGGSSSSTSSTSRKHNNKEKKCTKKHQANYKGFNAIEDSFCFHFWMRKRGVDTLEGISKLAVLTGLPVRAFGMAGIKDSFAVTQQRLSVQISKGFLENHVVVADVVEEDCGPRRRSCGSRSNSWALKRVRHLFAEAGIWEQDIGGDKSPKAPVTPDDYATLCGEHGISVADVTCEPVPLFPGNLAGNKFNLVIRNTVLSASCGDEGEGTSTANPTSRRQIVEQSFLDLRDKGFINYIGLQRFGKNGTRSDRIGLHYFKRDYVACFEELLYGSPAAQQSTTVGSGSGARGGRVGGNMVVSRSSVIISGGEAEQLQHEPCQEHGSSAASSSRPQRDTCRRPALPKWAAAFQRTGCWETALKYLPERLWAERRLLIAFGKTPPYSHSSAEHHHNSQSHQTNSSKQRRSYAECCRYAFLSLPRNIRVLYAHAYLDRIWNFAASERVRTYGAERVVKGDLVVVASEARTPGVGDVAHSDSSLTRHKKGNRTELIKLVATDDEAKEYSIFDVVLPRMGHKHLCGREAMPTHSVAKVMRDYLSYDGLLEDLELDTPLTSSENEDYDTHDSPPADTSHNNDTHDSVDESGFGVEMHLDPAAADLRCTSFWRIPGDYRRVLQRPKELTWDICENGDVGSASVSDSISKTSSSGDSSKEPIVKTSFILGPGQYATVLIRELLSSRQPPPPKQVFFDSDSD